MVKCPNCKKIIFDVATVDQRLNKCWECGLKFDNQEVFNMETINITLKKKDGWNTVNKSNAEKVLKNCFIKCDGHYTDDYARDAEENYQLNTKEDDCIKKLRRDIKEKD